MLGQILEAYTSYQRRVIQEEIQNTISQDEQVQRTEPVAEIPQPVLSSPAPVTFVQPAPVPQEEILRVVAAFSQAENQSWFSKMCLVSGAIAGFFLHAAHVGRLPFRVGAVPIGASAVYMTFLWNKSHSTSVARRAQTILNDQQSESQSKE